MQRLLKTLSAASAAVLVLTSCGNDLPLAVEPALAVNNIVFTRANQSRITFASGAKLYVWCAAWEPGLINTPSIHVAYGGPAATDPFWQLSAVVADVKIDQPISFPNTFVFDQPKNADLFLSDPTNELSTQAGGSSGAISFQRLTCAGAGEVQFSINAIIGSEFGGGPSVHASGNFRGAVGQAPS